MRRFWNSGRKNIHNISMSLKQTVIAATNVPDDFMLLVFACQYGNGNSSSIGFNCGATVACCCCSLLLRQPMRPRGNFATRAHKRLVTSLGAHKHGKTRRLRAQPQRRYRCLLVAVVHYSFANRCNQGAISPRERINAL